MQAIEGALQGILNTVSDSLALHPVIQWAGSLLGLVAPRGYPFRRVDYEFENDKEYVLGELLFYDTRVYQVTEAGTSPLSGGEPTHVGETEVVIGTGSLKLLHRGDTQPIWETNDGRGRSCSSCCVHGPCPRCRGTAAAPRRPEHRRHP